MAYVSALEQMLIILKSFDFGELKQQIQSVIKLLQVKVQLFSIVITGDSLITIEKEEVLKELLAKIIFKSKSVICC